MNLEFTFFFKGFHVLGILIPVSKIQCVFTVVLHHSKYFLPIDPLGFLKSRERDGVIFLNFVMRNVIEK